MLDEECFLPKSQSPEERCRRVVVSICDRRNPVLVERAKDEIE